MNLFITNLLITNLITNLFILNLLIANRLFTLALGLSAFKNIINIYESLVSSLTYKNLKLKREEEQYRSKNCLKL